MNKLKQICIKANNDDNFKRFYLPTLKKAVIGKCNVDNRSAEAYARDVLDWALSKDRNSSGHEQRTLCVRNLIASIRIVK